MMVYIYFRSQKIYKIEFELRKIFSLFTFTLVIFFISVFLKQYLTEAYFIIISVIFLIIFLVFSKIFKVIDISTIKSILTRQV